MISLLAPSARLRTILAGAAIFLVTLLLARWLYAEHRLLYDTDASYHLAIGRLYAEQGIVDELPELRYSLLRDGFGDKELLFHLALAPFAAEDDPAVGAPMRGGRWALATFNALVLTAVALAAVRAVGWWGLILPFWLVLTAPEWDWRLIRLRPELASLVLLIAGLWAAATRRPRVLAGIAFLYTLSYTAFHAFAGLIGLLVLFWGWSNRRIDWPLLLYTGLGTAVALVVHPHFPSNLEVWVIQNVDFFLAKGALDVGTEIRPNPTSIALLVNLGWWLSLLALWRSTEPASTPTATDRRLAEAFGLGALVFGVLYLLMSRFSLYAVPLITLALLFSVRARGRRLGGWTRLPGRGRIPVAVTIVLLLAISLPEAHRQLAVFGHRADAGPNDIRLVERQRFGRSVPEDAHVVAPWGQTALYMLWAPHGRYLNVLDPVFMARPYPREHALQDAIWRSVAPDVPLAAVAGLDSRFVAYSRVGRPATLTRRLTSDPRVEVRHADNNLLFEIKEDANDLFVLDWHVLPADATMPPPNDIPLDGWPVYPRAGDPRARGVEGFVDGGRLGEIAGCVAFVRDVTGVPELDDGLSTERSERGEDASVTVHWELAPWGPTRVWLDGEPLVAIEDNLHAVLGQGVVVPVRLTRPRHRLSILTCPHRGPDPPEPAQLGFYLLERRR